MHKNIDIDLFELIVQSSLIIFTQKYLHKCKDTYFILQNKYLGIYEDSFGTKILRDDCVLSKYLPGHLLITSMVSKLQMTTFIAAMCLMIILSKGSTSKIIGNIICKSIFNVYPRLVQK